MTLAPLLEAGWIIIGHTICALLALVLGAWQWMAAKGTTLHRAVGYIWVTMMMIVAASSFWIHDLRLIGPFSPIHLLSIMVLVNVPRAILAARRGAIDAHRKSMRSLYVLALLGAGAFTLLPGRVIHGMIFGG